MADDIVSVRIKYIKAIGSNYDHASLIYATVSGARAGDEELRFQPLLHLKKPTTKREPTAMKRTHIGKRRNRKKKKERIVPSPWGYLPTFGQEMRTTH